MSPDATAFIAKFNLSLRAGSRVGVRNSPAAVLPWPNISFINSFVKDYSVTCNASIFGGEPKRELAFTEWSGGNVFNNTGDPTLKVQLS